MMRSYAAFGALKKPEFWPSVITKYFAPMESSCAASASTSNERTPARPVESDGRKCMKTPYFASLSHSARSRDAGCAYVEAVTAETMSARVVVRMGALCIARAARGHR